MRSRKTIVQCPQAALSHDFPLDMPAILQRIYLNRGVTRLEEVQTALAGLLPFDSLLNIDKAAALLFTALQQQQRILIIGDFDADGATSTALAMGALHAFGARHVEYLIPNRFAYGYGLSPEIVAVAADRQPDLIITVDNGISSHEGVLAAQQHGMKVIITDHHLAPDTLPAADVIVNPNQPGDRFPSKAMAGVGVIFYVMLALRGYLREKHWFAEQQLAEPNMAQFLDLVALGTVADVVPLDQNNRILVQQGLRRIRAGQACQGIRALAQASQRDTRRLMATDLSFAIAPRLNAAGRLEDMSLGVACLLSTDRVQAQQMAFYLDNLNQERREIEASMLQQAEVYLKDFSLEVIADALCLYQPDWHQGVIGILAGRIKDRYHRPTIVFARVNDQELKGSGRSIPQLHLRDALALLATRHPSLVRKFGGHAMAAGLTIKAEDYPAFCHAFQEVVTQLLAGLTLQNVISTDGELSATELTVHTAEFIHAQGPWGQGFPEPLFDGMFKVLEQRLVADKHLKLVLQPENTTMVLDAIAFNWGTLLPASLETVRLAYRLDINDYGGQRRLQLMIEHLEIN